MKKTAQIVITALLLTTSYSTQADENVGTASDLESDVNIVDRGPSRIEEYKVGGRVYMIRVVPSKGLPYYLIDSDGNGSFETRRNELAPNMLIPSWVIFSW